MSENQSSYRRRDLVAGVGAAGAALILSPTAWAAQKSKTALPRGTPPAPPQEQGTTPSQQLGNIPTPKAIMTPMEDLASQHALASRILLVYELAMAKELGAVQPPMKAVASAANMLRFAVDDFHVKLEEEYLFPLFQKAGKMTDLVNTLHQQHLVARQLTDAILKTTSGTGGQPEALSPLLMDYSRMMLAHTAYEETLLYPQIAAVAGDGEYNKLQQTLLEANKQQLGPAGFAGMLVKVADLEKMAGITGLAKFTPKPGVPLAAETPKPGAPTASQPPMPGGPVAQEPGKPGAPITQEPPQP